MEKITGNALFLVKKSVLEQEGKEAWEKVLAAADPEVRAVVSGIVLSGNYYDRPIFQGTLAAIDEALGRQVLLDTADYQVDRQFKGFYGLLLKLVTLDMVLNRLDSMWAKTWQGGGRLALDTREDNAYRLLLSEFEMNDAHRAHLERFLARFLELLTHKKVQSSVRALSSTMTEFACVLG